MANKKGKPAKPGSKKGRLKTPKTKIPAVSTKGRGSAKASTDEEE